MPFPSAPTILVVEDDPVSRRLLQYTIERAGYVVATATDGLQAWQRLQQGDIDLLVADHQMPLCSGIELLGRIQGTAREGQRLVPAAILCTAKGHEIDHARLRAEFGLLAVIGKPFSPIKLTQLIHDHFSATEGTPGAQKTPNEQNNPGTLGDPGKPAGPTSWGNWPSLGRGHARPAGACHHQTGGPKRQTSPVLRIKDHKTTHQGV